MNPTRAGCSWVAGRAADPRPAGGLALSTSLIPIGETGPGPVAENRITVRAWLTGSRADLAAHQRSNCAGHGHLALAAIGLVVGFDLVRSV